MPVDLRSDTVTRPTPEMYAAMATAELDDDVLGHDPTTHRLEQLAAQMTGKEDAIFVPSGTMGNQIAIATHTRPGDSILVDDDAHILMYECAATAVLSSVQVRTTPSTNGVIDLDKLRQRYLHQNLHTPGSTLLCLENSHLRSGGTAVPPSIYRETRIIADALNMKIHLDGARLFNASVALGVPATEITQYVDSVTFCLSKGLSSPVGSVLCGTAAFIDHARLWRKRLGGGMRQSGILAACGIISLMEIVHKLADDHRRAKSMAKRLSQLKGMTVVPPQTNILMIDTDVEADKWIAALARKDVHVVSMGPNRVRAVFHKDVDDAQLEQACLAFKDVSDAGFD